MRILYVTPRFPVDLTFGDNLRAYQHIEHLSKKHDVTLLCLYHKKKELKNINLLNKFCKIIPLYQPDWKFHLNAFLSLFTPYPIRMKVNYNKRLRRIYSKIVKDFDFVYILSIQMAYLGKIPIHSKKVIDLVDTDSLLVKRKLEAKPGLMKPIYLLEFKRLKKHEKKLSKIFDAQIVVSNIEKKALGLENTYVFALGVQPSRKYVYKNKENIICVTGTMNYPPTVEGVLYFVKKIFPLIIHEVPGVKLKLIGAKPCKKIKKLANHPNIIVTGKVKNMAREIKKCKISLAPLRFGCGIQMKMLEAMATGTATVMSSIVNAGIEAKPNHETLVADEPEDFAYKVITLIKNDKLRKKIESNAYNLILRNYSLDIQNKRLDNLIKKII